MDFSVSGRAPGKHPNIRIHAAGTVSPSSVRVVSRRLIFFRIEPLGDDSRVTAVEALVKYRDGCMDEDEITRLVRRLMSGPQVVAVLGFPEVTGDEPPTASLHVIQATLRHATADTVERGVAAAAADVGCSVEAAAGSLEGLELDRDRELVLPAVAREPLVDAPKTMTAKCVRTPLRKGQLAPVCIPRPRPSALVRYKIDSYLSQVQEEREPPAAKHVGAPPAICRLLGRNVQPA